MNQFTPPIQPGTNDAKFWDRKVWANSVDLDQKTTSGSTLYAIPSHLYDALLFDKTILNFRIITANFLCPLISDFYHTMKELFIVAFPINNKNINFFYQQTEASL